LQITPIIGNFVAFKIMMRRITFVNLVFILTGLLLYFSSCAPESCYEETESYLEATFYDNETIQIQAPDSLTIYGMNMEAIKIYNKSTKIQTALLPLNASTDSCVFIFIINGITDTIEFRYNSYPHLVSKECGYTFYHNIDQPESTSNIIKGIYLNKSNITTQNEENIRIFY
jgi:hypothetical protein